MDLTTRTDQQIRDLIQKLEILGAKPGTNGGRMVAELQEELRRRAVVDRDPGACNPNDEWICEVSPGRWITMNRADLAASVASAIRHRNLTAADVDQAIQKLLAEGRMRPNPTRVTIKEES
jgi:hypothetical protein